jgi:hypothetical protein
MVTMNLLTKVVEIDLLKPDFLNSKTYDRILWCFSNTITETIQFFLAADNLDLGPALEPFNTEKRVLVIDQDEMTVIGPKWESIELTTDGPEVLEWIGLAIQKSPR